MYGHLYILDAPLPVFSALDMRCIMVLWVILHATKTTSNGKFVKAKVIR
jgi:hypothetical protein